jgi:NAD(P)-dependent dehydrogenase (short-subunit alcohol dehydrogenase family)
MAVFIPGNGRHTLPGAVVAQRRGYDSEVARDLASCVVVITGASSGIGRAAAQQFALEGSRLVLAARAEGPLREAVGECERLGATALAVPTDVRDESAVQTLAARAVERFGRLDVWVNGAGVMAYGRFGEIPSEVFRAIIETNLFGQVHGARAALAHFHEQRTGVLINLCSVWGRVTAPDVSAYVTSKFAVRAFGECLRQELRDLPDVDVATMLPQAVDTPIFARAGNYSGRSVRPIPPIVDPEEVARGIVRCAKSPKREVTYSRMGRLLGLWHSLLPGAYHRFLPPAFEAGNYANGHVSPTAGVVLQPEPSTSSVTGRWKSQRRGELRRAFLATVVGSAQGLRRRPKSGHPTANR